MSAVRNVVARLVVIFVISGFTASSVFSQEFSALVITDYTITCSSVSVTYTSQESFGQDFARVEVYVEDPWLGLHYSDEIYSPFGDTIELGFDPLPEGTVITVSIYLSEMGGFDSISIPCTNEVEDAPTGGSSLPVAPPCNNLYDGRINDSQALDCAAPIAIYYDTANDRIVVYGVNPVNGKGDLAATVPLDNVSGATNTTVVATTHPWYSAPLVITRLSTGEWQLSTTYADGKPYIVVWSNPDDLYHLAA